MKVACEHRMQKLLQHQLVESGLAKFEHTTEEEYGAKTGFKKVSLVLIASEEEVKKKVKQIKEKQEYEILAAHKARLSTQERELLKAAADIFGNSMIWNYCKRVKGLGEVAAMTFFTIMDTDKIVDSRNEVITAGKINKYLGLVPGQRLQSGKNTGFNTQMKGRAWMISRNVIMANDPYYAGFYRLQKEFYRMRPDIVAQNGYTVRDAKGHYISILEQKGGEKDKDGKKTINKKNKTKTDKEPKTAHCALCNEEVKVVAIEDHKKRPGWNAWTDAMASRYMRKILISHIVEIIAMAEGRKFSKHRNYIPMKPEFPDEIDRELDRFRTHKLEQLQRYHKVFAATGSIEVVRDNMISYWEKNWEPTPLQRELGITEPKRREN